jgi:hypothetical protein
MTHIHFKAVHASIDSWYSDESNKIKFQSQASEYQQEEKTMIYHHELHRKRIKRFSILKLDTGAGMLKGHQACADFLEQTVEDLLLNPAELNQAAQECLLSEVDLVFTPEDNNCHSPTQPQLELELDLIMGRNPPPPTTRNF